MKLSIFLTTHLETILHEWELFATTLFVARSNVHMSAMINDLLEYACAQLGGARIAKVLSREASS